VKNIRETEHLVRLTRFRFVNAYLVREDDGLTLVDTGMRGADKKILAAAEDLGAPIARIVVTHYHDDHTGSLDKLVQQLPDAERLWSEREDPLIHGGKELLPGEPEGKVRAIKGKKAQATRLLNAGDRVGSLEVVAAPGHSPGQIALVDTRDKTLIAGDAYSSVGGVATTAGPYWKFFLPGLVTWNRDVALQTARELRALEPRRLAPGHGKVVDDPVAAMDAAIKRSS
jgi:glyoxylase-like metal-dependent hydrolase (beta-lactamase superfamily II)